MRNTQFWILLLGSILVSILFIKQIFLSRALDREQRLLVDARETAATGAAWENTWQKLAIQIYQASRQDPALADVLKNEKVGIHPTSAPAAGSTPATTPSTPPPASSKTTGAPPHPASP